MMSFQIGISPSKRAAGRFVASVRRSLQKAFVEERAKSGLSQSDIARAIGVHRSVINRELRGVKDLTLSRVAELAWAMGRKPTFDLLIPQQIDGENIMRVVPPTITQSVSSGNSERVQIKDDAGTIRRLQVA